MVRTLFVVLLPSLAAAILYVLFLGDRSDYAGHFMAGLGGTLIAIVGAHRLLADHPKPPSRNLLIILVCLGSIAIGTFTELTMFRLAKFDEVDYFNQNIGAVLASLSALAVLPEPGRITPSLTYVILIGVCFLFAGFFYAFS